MDGLLGHAQPFGQLSLGDAVFFAQAGNAFAQGNEKITFLRGKGDVGGKGGGFILLL
ncbi:hypothetical protein [Pseudomonas sp. MWU13-3659]|uniref:hypothetical protein n=1 Tax=Pseudomonas sp. MWU13-3659 TaxID=2986964 RepID=UPI002074AC9D|nr:hypothetical protein [Pseudomonas sp. MWU13-3659]